MWVTVAKETDPLLNKPRVVVINTKTVDDAPQNEIVGYALMLLSTVFYSLMRLISRTVTAYDGMPVATLVFLRGAVQTVCAAIGILYTSNHLDLQSVSRRAKLLVVLRGVLGATALSLNYHAISKLPLGVVTSIFFLNPIFTLLLSSTTLGERIGLLEALAAVMSFCGAVLVADPWDALAGSRGDLLDYTVGIILALSSAFLAAMVYVTLRSISREVPSLLSVLAFGISVLAVGVCRGGASVLALSNRLSTTALALVGSLIGFFGQCALTKGYQYCRAGTGALVRNLDVPLSYVLALVVLSEVPSPVSLYGSMLVLSGTLLVGLTALRRNNNDR